jgi:hypothetical protein
MWIDPYNLVGFLPTVHEFQEEHICEFGDGPAAWLSYLASQAETHNRAQLIPLPEPFKVRCISKGEPIRYYLLRTLQKSLFKAMQRFPVFALTGRPVAPGDFNERFGQLLRDEFFVSGDYKDATNQLNGQLSEAFAREFVAGLRDRDIASRGSGPLSRGDWGEIDSHWDSVERFFVDSLTQHELSYTCQIKTRAGETLSFDESGYQMKGQLMGSLSSFPVLCAVNFALWLSGKEFSGLSGLTPQSAKFHLHHGRVLINGDDIAFPSTRRHSDAWARCATLAGLELSVGKSYESGDWVTMNSEFFDYIPQGALLTGQRDRLDPAFSSTFYSPGRFIPIGTLFGASSRGIGTAMRELVSGGDDHLWSLSDGLNYVLDCAPDKYRDDIVSLFIASHPELKNDCPAGVSWFIPKALGGLGIRHPGTVTDVQLKSAVLRIYERSPARLRGTPTKYLEPKKVQAKWMSEELVSYDYSEKEPCLWYPGLSALATEFDYTSPAEDWFKSCPPHELSRWMNVKAPPTDEAIMGAYQKYKRYEALREFEADHRKFMAMANRSEVSLEKWSLERLWSRLWAVERVGIGSMPAPTVDLRHVLGAGAVSSVTL